MGRKRLTTEKFIEKAREIHGDKYDYSKVKYVDYNTKVCIICPVHGEFQQKPNSHLQGCGCQKCSSLLRDNENRLTTDEFIKRAREIHGDKYGYSKFIYNGYDVKSCIICPEHGEFWQRPQGHLHGSGCPLCANERRRGNKEFIDKAKTIYGDKYDYSKVNYVNSKTKVCIICPEHGEFWITPNNFLRGHNCNGKTTSKLTTDDFIKRAKEIHKNKYDYTKVKYVNSRTKVCIICPEHGEFWQTPYNHVRGKGCPMCSVNALKTKESFIKKATEVHYNKYDYSKLDYRGNKKKVCIICPEHGEFWQSPSYHLSGGGCPSCNNSALENEIFKSLKNNNFNFVREKTFKWLKNGKGQQRLDFYLVDYNIAIECQGEQHFKVNSFFGGIEGLLSTQYRDYVKYEKCKKHKINILYYIPYDYEEYRNIFYEDKFCFKNNVELINFVKENVQ